MIRAPAQLLLLAVALRSPAIATEWVLARLREYGLGEEPARSFEDLGALGLIVLRESPAKTPSKD